MGPSPKAQELRALMGLAIRLRALAQETEDDADAELFLSAALALEERANRLAFGPALAEAPRPPAKIDITC